MANPYPTGGTRSLPNGAAFAGPALYTDSLLVLAGRSGRLLWYDQVTPHDLRDYDFQLPPILAQVASSNGNESLILGAGKAGIVVAWNPTTHHKRVWQRLVRHHTVHAAGLAAGGHRSTICPGFYGGVESAMAYSDGSLFVADRQPLHARQRVRLPAGVGSLNPISGIGSVRRARRKHGPGALAAHAPAAGLRLRRPQRK